MTDLLSKRRQEQIPLLLLDLDRYMYQDDTMYAATIWAENDKTKTEYVGTYSTIMSLAKEINKQYPTQFPSIDQLIDELITINTLNWLTTRNSFGCNYPMNMEYMI